MILQYVNSIIAIISHCYPKTNSVGYLKKSNLDRGFRKSLNLQIS